MSELYLTMMYCREDKIKRELQNVKEDYEFLLNYLLDVYETIAKIHFPNMPNNYYTLDEHIKRYIKRSDNNYTSWRDIPLCDKLCSIYPYVEKKIGLYTNKERDKLISLFPPYVYNKILDIASRYSVYNHYAFYIDRTLFPVVGPGTFQQLETTYYKFHLNHYNTIE